MFGYPHKQVISYSRFLDDKIWPKKLDGSLECCVFQSVLAQRPSVFLGLQVRNPVPLNVDWTQVDIIDRFLLGFMQGGFIPDVVLYLSYFYTKSERTLEPFLLLIWDINRFAVPIRLAFFWISNYMSDIISAFLATGILRLRGVNGKEGWRYLFLIEGLITLSVGLTSWFLMPAGPTQTKTWFRPKGWFSDR